MFHSLAPTEMGLGHPLYGFEFHSIVISEQPVVAGVGNVTGLYAK